MSRIAIIYRENNVPYVLAKRLSPEARQLLWQAIQDQQPHVANMLANDPFIAELRQRFNASYELPLSEYRRLMKLTKDKAA